MQFWFEEDKKRYNIIYCFLNDEDYKQAMIKYNELFKLDMDYSVKLFQGCVYCPNIDCDYYIKQK